jgi:hypothetical protein
VRVRGPTERFGSARGGRFTLFPCEEGGPEGPEFLREDAFYFGQVERFAAELGLHGGDSAVGRADAAGDDAGEVGEVGVHVEREAVVGGPAFYGDADGGDFAGAEPDAGFAGAAGGGEAEVADGIDENLFEEAEVLVEIFAREERDDRVTYDLAGAVVGDVAAAVCLHDFNTLGGELGGRPDEVGVGAAALADGEDGVVFGEDEGVADFVFLTLGEEFFLPAPGGFVAGASPVERGGGEGGRW